MKRLFSVLVVFLLALAFALSALAQDEATPKKKSRRQISKEKDLTEELCEVATDFNKLIVWKGFDQASMMVKDEKRLWFLNEAEKVRDTVHIEDFKIALCQVLDKEPIRKIKPAQTVPGLEEIMPTPTPAPKAPDGKDLQSKKMKKKSKKSKAPEVYYGLVLARFVNQSTMPSNKVVTRLVKEYWIYDAKQKVWFIDTDLNDLFTD